ncbi:23S rRNA (guanosine(2251)-2'-O)-methyltransferase RlmB [Mycoplasma sp. P36-A1]|uniref:23S rRNA (guanosine(2251)-2'-O)-methyltransferase RlmB n=1 Tax=Mycoplasma sp. P36-A1 TaxID=3252900 RepID=UPI003C2EBB34
MYYYGKNTIKGLIESKTQLETVFISDKFNDTQFLNYLDKKRIKYIIVSLAKIESMSNNANHQGVVAKSFDFEYKSLETIIAKTKDKENSTVLILDGLEDPQNFGSLIRTSEALAVDGIVITKNRSVKVTPTVARVATGAINGVDICMVTNLKQTVDKLKKAGYWVVCAHMNTDVLYDQVDYKGKMALVVGSEGKGVSTTMLKESDFVVKLPMYGEVSSLNAAVSGAIIMYEMDSNRRK